MAYSPRAASPFASLFAKNRAGKGRADEVLDDEDDTPDDEDKTDEAKKARKAKKAKADDEQDEKDEDDPKASAARGRERARIEAILLCPGAQRGGGMATAAVHMAINTSTPRGTAIRTLAGMAGITATVATTGAGSSRHRAPDAVQQPHGADLATAIVQAGEARRGERFFGSMPKPAAPREAMTAAGIIAAAAAARGEEAPEMIAGPVQNGHVTTGAEMLAVMKKRRGEA